MAALEIATDDFEKEHPDTDIDLRTGGSDYEQQMKVRLAANDLPDIWETHGWSLLRYSPFLAPLQSEEWAADVNSSLAPAMNNADGEFFALPIDVDVAGIVVNETVLNDAGVSVDDITDWDAFIAAASKVADSGVVPLTIAGGKDGAAGNVVDWLAPGAYSEDELTSLSDGAFDNDPYESVLDTLEEFRANGWVNPDYSAATGDDMARAMAEGKAAFALTRNLIVAQAQAYAPDADLQFIPIPALAGGESYLIGGENTGFGAAKDGAHLSEAKQYLAYLATPEVIATLAAATGNLPGLTNAESDLGALSESFDKWFVPGDVPLLPYFDRVYLPNGMWDTVVTTADAVLAGQATPAESMPKVESDFETLYKASK